MSAKFLAASALADLPGVRHGFFTRRGGVSQGIYSSLNTGLGSRDTRENALANRARALRALDGEALATPLQYHSDVAAIVSEPWPVDEPERADAVVTDRPGLAIAVNTADCTPVLFADARAGVVGAAHAGWKGALDGVLQSTLQAMEKLGARRQDIVCAIGPVISQSNYEVGPEFHARFLAEEKAHARFFAPSSRPGRFMFDLPAFVTMVLERAGVGRIEDLKKCTYGEEELFYSYRRSVHRNEPDYGRQLSAIMLMPD